MKEFCAFRPKAYVYLMDNGGEKKKANGADYIGLIGLQYIHMEHQPLKCVKVK